MAAPYSIDFRQKVFNSYLERGSLRKTADRFDVSFSFVQALVKRCKTENTLEPKPHQSGNPPKVQPVHFPFLKKMINSDNDLSLREICDRFQKEFSVKVSITAMHETLKRLEISRKKKL